MEDNAENGTAIQVFETGKKFVETLLEGDGKIEINGLRSLQATDIAPANATLGFQLGGGRLSLGGTLDHPELERITIDGHTPLNISDLPGADKQTIDLSFHLPETNLELAKKYIPNLVTATGTASADVRVTGTVKAPVLAGGLHIRSPLLKFRKQQIPTISDLKIGLQFEEDRLEIDSFHGFVLL